MYCAGAALGSATLIAQATKGDWPMAGGDPGQNRWQKAEAKLSGKTVPADFKFLWKIQLGKPAEVGAAFTEPLLASRLINAEGFKDIVYWPSSNALYAVDSELGNLLWTKHFEVKSHRSATGCGASTLSTAMEPPVVINFGARRAPGARPAAPAPPMATGERRLGVSPGGGGFGLRGIYVLTNDGMLHEQVLTTGADFAPPIKFLPAADGSASGLNVSGKTIYTGTARNCPGVANGLWAVDISAASYPVATFSTGKVRSLDLTGPALASDGTAFFVTGDGAADSSAGIYPNSIVAVGKDMKLRDWYTPAKGAETIQNITPATFPYKGKQYVVAPGQNGSFVLLDAASLGGADHRSPLSETASFSAPGSKHPWDGFAIWLDKDGTAWVFASVSATITPKANSATANGPAAHGGIIAFRVDDADQKPILTPVWISRDMVNPAPPTVANGVVVALAGGNPSIHATLYVFDATTGKELFSSKDTISTSTHLSGVAVGDSHAFFTDRNGTLYSFGIGIEH
jgi:outer membrane protein assembly factor BamB